MASLSELMSHTFGDARAPESRVHETMLAIAALFVALALSAVWGVAAGSTSAALALANAYKVPMVILLSALAALPAGLVALRVVGAPLPGHQLVGALTSAIFGGALALATLAPLVAIYYHTSIKAGLPIALGSVFVAIALASWLFVRAVARRVAAHPRRTGSLVGAAILVAIFLAALLQFVAMASPIISAITPFSGGFDTVFR